MVRYYGFSFFQKKYFYSASIFFMRRLIKELNNAQPFLGFVDIVYDNNEKINFIF